jgi:hypothetical protein
MLLLWKDKKRPLEMRRLRLRFIVAFSEQLYYELSLKKPGRGVSEKVSAVGFCLGSGLFGSCNSD